MLILSLGFKLWQTYESSTDTLVLYFSGVMLHEIPTLLRRRKSTSHKTRDQPGFGFTVMKEESTVGWTAISVSGDNTVLRHDHLVLCGAENTGSGRNTARRVISITASKEVANRVKDMTIEGAIGPMVQLLVSDGHKSMD